MLTTSIIPFDVSRISLLEDGVGLPIDDKLSILNLDHAVELAIGRVILEHGHQAVEVNKGVIDSNNFYFANCREEGSLGNQTTNSVKSAHTNLYCCVYGRRLSLQEKMQMSLEQIVCLMHGSTSTVSLKYLLWKRTLTFFFRLCLAYIYSLTHIFLLF